MSRPAGIYVDIDAAEYHGDPCEAPSLSNSIAQVLLNQSPWHAWHCHPRLNPGYQPDAESSRRLDLGSVAHALLLCKGKRIEIMEFDDYRTKAAQLARDEARRAGLLPVLTADYERATEMVGKALKVIGACSPLREMFPAPAAVSEAVVIWKEGEAWCRSMIDRTDMRVVMDYKTVVNAQPAAVAKHIYSMGYHVQRAFYLRGLDAIDPPGAGRRKFLFLCQEIDHPYACSVHEFDGTGALLGERLADQAIRTWQDCIAADRWPSYHPEINRAAPPPWLENSILAQELEAAQ